jgi:DNA-binding transcriptional LysR family regulator
MELRHLRYFVAVAEDLNITRAAARLNVTQPPLSRQIRALEKEMGIALFERRNRMLVLTRAGGSFLDDAKKILSHVDRAVGTAHAVARGHAGKITIAFLSPLGGMFLPEVLRAFRAKAPAVDVDLVEMVPRQQIDALLDHRVDLAVVPKAEVDPASDLAFEPMMDVEFRVAVSHEHALAKTRRIPLAKLESERFVLFRRSAAPAIHEVMLRACRAAGFEPNVVKYADHAQSIVDLVAAGVGVSILPEPFSRYRAALALRPFTPMPPAQTLGIAWRRRDASQLLQSLRAAIREHFSCSAVSR